MPEAGRARRVDVGCLADGEGARAHHTGAARNEGHGCNDHVARAGAEDRDHRQGQDDQADRPSAGPSRPVAASRIALAPRCHPGRQEGAEGIFEPRHHRLVVGRRHALDHGEKRSNRCFARPRVETMRWNEASTSLAVSAEHVVKRDALADLEGERPSTVGCLRHFGAQIAYEVVGRCGVRRVDADQYAIEGAIGWMSAKVVSRCPSKLGGASGTTNLRIPPRFAVSAPASAAARQSAAPSARARACQ